MKNTRIAVGTLISEGVPASKKSEHLTPKVFDDVQRMERAWPEALVAGDIDTLEQIWAEDFALTGPDGTQISREDCLASLCGNEIKFELFDTDPREVLINGDDAVVSGSVRVECPRGLPFLNTAQHYVSIYSRREDGWQQVAAIVTSAVERDPVPSD